MLLSGIGIVGSRRRNSANDRLIVQDKFFQIYEPGDIIISGGCPKGGDRFAEVIAKDNGIPILIFYPDWQQFGRFAGLKRNTPVAMHSTKALIACVAEDRKGGTEDTISKYLSMHEDGELILC